MPGYAILSDMTARFPEVELMQLTDDERTGAIVEARVLRALEEAGNLVDGYVGAKYQRADEADPVPPLLIDLTCDMAFFRLHKRSGPVPERIENANKAALAQLRDIAKGVIKLDRGVEALPERDGMILTSGREKVFGRDQLGGF